MRILEKELDEERSSMCTKEEMLYTMADNMLSEFQDFNNGNSYKQGKIKKVNMKNGMVKSEYGAINAQQ